MTAGSAASVAALLNIIEQSPETTLHAVSWEAELGVANVASLVRMGVLEVRSDADWYPCDDAVEADCARFVERQPDSSAHPLRAVCSRRGSLCPSVRLAERDVRLLGLSRGTLVHRLRQAFGISGPVETGDAGFPETSLIGQLGRRDVFLALLPGIPGFEAWLAMRRDAFVMVPIGRWLSTATKDRFRPGQCTELVILEEVLELVDGRFVLKRPIASEGRQAGMEALSGVFRQPTVCVLHENGGRRELTATQYRQIVDQAAQCDLFVDTTAVVKRGGVRAGKRTPDGRHEEVVLTRNEAAAIVELVTAGRALRRGDFRQIAASHVNKIVEHARRKLDVALGRYEWRTIHTIKGSVPAAKGFVFRPPEGLRWAVIVAPHSPSIGPSQQ
jgi:hypothetical protein